jgi:hypothetical protein
MNAFIDETQLLINTIIMFIDETQLLINIIIDDTIIDET